MRREGQSTGTIDMEGKTFKMYRFRDVWLDNGGSKMCNYRYI